MIHFNFHNEFQLAGYVYLLSAEWLQRAMAERYLVDLIEAMSYVRRAGYKGWTVPPWMEADGYSYWIVIFLYL